MATIALEHPDHPGRSGRVRCQLVVVDGPDMGRAVSLGAAGVKVGSDRACGLVLGDTGVSRQHLQITAEPDGQFLVEDLGSKNGTLYEGAKVSALRVPAGATLRIGRTSLRIQAEAHVLRLEASRSQRLGELVGVSLVMREVFAVLELAAASDVTVLLEGETGTGKELAARAIHEASAPSAVCACSRSALTCAQGLGASSGWPASSVPRWSTVGARSAVALLMH